ncbi:hypothetical protein B0H16DRAFT_1484340 [Mycena metata]|uniref:Uncharacterized protein n=1 Tax=Mycena metata TaxID=1033252 RepID=A0AAD7DSM6_9AGAR|nr:hypothetical protein B0H16DRAFT_1484340 [Mycena metata]
MSRSNTDVTSLLSGTSVKAVISYVSDYVSKLGLKTYQAFASVHDVFNRNTEVMNSGATGTNTSKNLMRQMINSMSTKLEIGSPMAAMYLLGNPDHYKSHTYVNFPWRTYVTFVQNEWKLKMGFKEDQEDLDDVVLLKNDNGTYVASSCVDNYRYRPIAYENVTLYEWIQCSEVEMRSRKERAEFEADMELTEKWAKNGTGDYDDMNGTDHSDDEGDNYSDLDDFILHDDESELSNDEDSDAGKETDDSDYDWDSDTDDATVVRKEKKKSSSYKAVRHAFLPEHKALYLSHSVHCDFRKIKTIIPNFLGGAVPRADKGNRDYYCATMLTLFKAWRSPMDLKDNESTWDQAFEDHTFTERQLELIANFNLRYECNDARDDHYAIMRKKNGC